MLTCPIPCVCTGRASSKPWFQTLDTPAISIYVFNALRVRDRRPNQTLHVPRNANPTYVMEILYGRAEDYRSAVNSLGVDK
jgi:hypothetical protein